MGINPCPLSSPTTPNRGQQLGINPGSLDGRQQMGINLCPYTIGTTNENQPMSTKFILLGVCSHKTVSKRWDKTYKTYWCWTHTIIKGCGHNMVDNKWESTHVYQAHLIKRSYENSKRWVGSHSISTGLMLPQQQVWRYQMANNKWALTHVCQTHIANNNNKRQQMRINQCLLHLSRFGFMVIGNK